MKRILTTTHADLTAFFLLFIVKIASNRSNVEGANGNEAATESVKPMSKSSLSSSSQKYLFFLAV